MKRCPLIIAVPALTLILLLTAARPASAAAPPASDWIPDNALMVVEAPRPQVLIDWVTRSSLTRTVQSTDAWRRATMQPGYLQFRQGVAFVEQLMQTDWKTGLGALTAEGVTLAVLGQDQVVMIAEAKDPAMLTRLHGTLAMFAQTDAANKGRPETVRNYTYAGATCWSFNGTEAHTVIGNRLVFASRADVLQRVLDLRSGPGGGSLSDHADYRAAMKAADDGAALRSYVNFKTIKQHPALAAALTSGADNPLAALLMAPLFDAAKQAKWLAMSLDVRGEILSLTATTDPHDPRAEVVTEFATPPAGGGALTNLRVPRRLAAMSFYRDLQDFYAAKDQLFPQRTSGLIFFENMMGIFFTGRDLTDEVLSQLGPQVRLVVAEQTFADAATSPQVKWPGVAAVFTMHEPDRFALMAEEAWQKALGMINFTRGQQAQPGLLIDRPTHAGVKYTMAYFSEVGGGAAGDDTRFNFSPCIARVGKHLILSSTDALTRDLIDSLRRESGPPAKPIAGQHSIIEVEGEQLGSILHSNRDTLVRKNMLEKGHTQTQAQGEIDMLIALIHGLGRATLQAGVEADRPRVTLELNPNAR